MTRGAKKSAGGRHGGRASRASWQVRRLLWAAPLILLPTILAVPLLAVAGGLGQPKAPAASVPGRALAAYRGAQGACPGLRWELLAGVGWVESRHGTSKGATLDPGSGEARPWIFGPPLDGRGGRQPHPAGRWLGWWGLPGPYEQALGPMQFRAPTFAAVGRDGDGDGTANPHDLDDAAASAAAYLCGTDGAMDDERAALARYNRSGAYADQVLAYANALSGSPVGPGAGWLCPVAGPTSFTDTWGAPRSGGRRHQGVDMFAATGTPVVAPVGGEVEHYVDELGGLSFRLWGADGNFYFGTHLSAAGRVTGAVGAGTVVGSVGASGNAVGTSPHLHFEVHPGRGRGQPRGPVNPTPWVSARCGSVRIGPGLSPGDD